jgi:hypothetical protein
MNCKNAFKKNVTVLLLTSFIWHGCSQSVDCSKVKNGKFSYISKSDRRKVFIERYDSIQVEYDYIKKDTLKSRIVWQDDCKFQMFINAFSEAKPNSQDSFYATHPVIVEIVQVTHQYYICKVNFSTGKRDIELRDTMYIQK